MNSLKNWLAVGTKACGKVQNIPAVAPCAGGTVRTPWPAKLLIED